MSPEEFLAGAPLPPADHPLLRFSLPALEDRAIYLAPVDPWLYTDPAVCPPPLELAVRDRHCDAWAARMGGGLVRNDYQPLQTGNTRRWRRG